MSTIDFAEQHCPTCGAPARYLKIPHPDGEGTTIPLPIGALGGKWYHDTPYAVTNQTVALSPRLIVGLSG